MKREQATTKFASILLISALLVAGIYVALVFGLDGVYSSPLPHFGGVATPVILFRCQGNQTIQSVVENGKNVSSLDGRNDLNCFDGVSCEQTIDTPPAVGLFVKVISDSGAGISNSSVSISGYASFECAGGAGNQSRTNAFVVGKFSLYNVSSTSLSDPIAINPYGVGNYSLQLVFNNKTYAIPVQRPSGAPQLVSVSVPSGRVNVENFTCVCAIVGLETSLSSLQAKFSQAGYDILVSKSVNFTTFDISNSAGQKQLVQFRWSAADPVNSLPSPSVATAFNGNVVMQWWLGTSGAVLDMDILVHTAPCANDTAYQCAP